MNVFLARQPIFDIENKVVAYEILFRNGEKNFYTGSDGDSSTLDVIVNTFYSLGVQHVTGGKKAFINFTEDLLVKEVATVLPPEILTIEILENIEPTTEVISACVNLKNKGYNLALDDFVFDEINDILQLVISYESGKWDQVYEYSKKANVNFEFISQAYIDALFWSNNV